MRGQARILTINGLQIPTPDEGFEIIESDLVDGGRNANGVTVGQRINTIWKINNLQWSRLTPDEWRHIKNLLKPFYVKVKFIDDYNNPHECIMYPGDRSSKPVRGVVNVGYNAFKECKFNLIDTGK